MIKKANSAEVVLHIPVLRVLLWKLSVTLAIIRVNEANLGVYEIHRSTALRFAHVSVDDKNCSVTYGIPVAQLISTAWLKCIRTLHSGSDNVAASRLWRNSKFTVCKETPETVASIAHERAKWTFKTTKDTTFFYYLNMTVFLNQNKTIIISCMHLKSFNEKHVSLSANLKIPITSKYLLNFSTRKNGVIIVMLANWSQTILLWCYCLCRYHFNKQSNLYTYKPFRLKYLIRWQLSRISYHVIRM